MTWDEEEWILDMGWLAGLNIKIVTELDNIEPILSVFGGKKKIIKDLSEAVISGKMFLSRKYTFEKI